MAIVLTERLEMPMTREQVRWFTDPVEFLNNLGNLSMLHLRAYCRRCVARGLRDDLRVVWKDDEGAWDCHCACHRVAGRVPLSAIAHYAHSTDELLRRLGWDLCCAARCDPGRDGVEGNNTPGHDLLIRCGCTDRIYREAA